MIRLTGLWDVDSARRSSAPRTTCCASGRRQSTDWKTVLNTEPCNKRDGGDAATISAVGKACVERNGMCRVADLAAETAAFEYLATPTCGLWIR
jgi:hypothetical protein